MSYVIIDPSRQGRSRGGGRGRGGRGGWGYRSKSRNRSNSRRRSSSRGGGGKQGKEQGKASGHADPIPYLETTNVDDGVLVLSPAATTARSEGEEPNRVQLRAVVVGLSPVLNITVTIPSSGEAYANVAADKTGAVFSSLRELEETLHRVSLSKLMTMHGEVACPPKNELSTKGKGMKFKVAAEPKLEPFQTYSFAKTAAKGDKSSSSES